MNGIDKIAGKIAEDAKREVDSILAEAKTQAAGIADKYAALAKEESNKLLAAGEERSKEIRRLAVSAADTSAPSAETGNSTTDRQELFLGK